MNIRRRGILVVLAFASLAVTARGADEPGLGPGGVLSSENASSAEELLPPEIHAFYAKGEWKNEIVDWPLGRMDYDVEFVEGTKENAKRLVVDDAGGIVDRESGEKPPVILGFPFPEIDPKDPRAGVKIVWNYNYMYYNLGNTRNFVDIVWVGRDGVERVSGQEVFFLYYDGQKAKYRPKENPNNLLVQFIATSTSPQDLYGTTALSWRFRDSDKRDTSWAYVPALRRIRAVSPTNRSDGFLGSDMTQDDGPFFDGKPEDFEWRLVGEKEVLRVVDAESIRGENDRILLPEGGWRDPLDETPIAGFEDPDWKGAPWAPVGMKLARRKAWIVEAVPKDEYYVYGKLELYFDQENFQGMYNRKFSWSGELLSTYVVTGFRNGHESGPDGEDEWFWDAEKVYQAAVNLKHDRATITGFPLKNRPQAINDRRLVFDPSFFDYQTLYRFGK